MRPRAAGAPGRVEQVVRSALRGAAARPGEAIGAGKVPRDVQQGLSMPNCSLARGPTVGCGRRCRRRRGVVGQDC